MKASILLLALLSSAAFARGGDGGAFNGPTLSPISVPSQADHPITDADIKEATDICFAKGDAALGVKSVMQRLMDEVYPGIKLAYPATKVNIDSQDAGDTPIQDNSWKINSAYVADRVSSQPAGIGYITTDDDVYLSFDQVSGPRVHLNADGKPVKARDLPTTSVLSTGKLPYVTADYDYQYLFDKWGNVTKTTKVMKNVRIQDAGAKSLTFINTTTQRPVPLMINVKEYVQCLQGEMQNLASKH